MDFLLVLAFVKAVTIPETLAEKYNDYNHGFK